MTYIDYLNSFNLWLESNALPANSQLMFFKFLNVFNRAGWPEYVQVDTLRLMMMIDTSDKRTAYRARGGLVDAKFLSYDKGSKGKPSRYYLLSQNATVSATVNATLSGTENGTQNGTRLYTNNINNNTIEKTKNKTKTIYDSDFGKVYSAFADSIEPLASQFIIDELRNFYEKMDAECCLKAIEIAVSGGIKTKNWNYVKGVLKKKLGRGVHSIDDWNRDEQNTKLNGFMPPTAEMVEEYCKEIGRYIEVTKFLNYYNSVGWKRGRTQITDWKPLVMSWADMNQEYEEIERNKKKKRRGRHIEIIDGQEVSVYDD